MLKMKKFSPQISSSVWSQGEAPQKLFDLDAYAMKKQIPQGPLQMIPFQKFVSLKQSLQEFILKLSPNLPSNSVILSQDDFAPRGRLSMSVDIFGCHNWGWGASDIQNIEPGVLLNALQYTRQPPNKVLSDPKYQQC